MPRPAPPPRSPPESADATRPVMMLIIGSAAISFSRSGIARWPVLQRGGTPRLMSTRTGRSPVSTAK